MRNVSRADLVSALAQLRTAAADSQPVAGLTHAFYRYPARFSPSLASAAISAFSSPGDLVLDPYMGGGTSVVEALVQGRRVVGCDLNSLAVFLASVKCTRLSPQERSAVVDWANERVPSLRYSTPLVADNTLCPRRTRNLDLPRCRPLKKVIALALESLEVVESPRARAFGRVALLNVGQWALNGKRVAVTASAFRERLQSTTLRMLLAEGEFSTIRQNRGKPHLNPILIEDSAENLSHHSPFVSGERATLVITSPPYPGIHMLYHRWQVDGRKESPAPYWIAGREDGRGNAFYNFSDRRREDAIYFEQSLKTLKAIREVTKDGGMMVQMLAFAEPHRQLHHYLRNMTIAGFRELRGDTELGHKTHRRIWRDVPGRRWHAGQKGDLQGAREVVLVHVAE
jgi:hypothetical protein